MAACLLLQTATAQETLRISIKEGEGALNDSRRGRGTEITVEVRDASNQPVPGAEVVFNAPSIGAGVVFADGSSTFKAVTDANGLARTAGLKPNRIEGRFNIKVTVTAGDRKTSLVVPQVNTMAGGTIVQQGGGGGSKTKLIVGLISAGASVGLLATRLGGGGNNSGTPPRPPTTLTVGGVTVGGPR